MKKYLILLFMLASSLCPAKDKPAIQGDLPEPVYRNKEEQAGTYAPRLKRHIDSGDLVAFYKEAARIFKEMDANNSEQAYIDRMWIFYYIANAPMYETNFDKTSYYPFWDDDDISTKALTISNLERYGRNDATGGFNFDKKLIQELFIIYSARIFRDFHAAYDHDLNAKIETMKTTPGLTDRLEQLRILDSKYSINSRRNSKLPSNIETYEEVFVAPLVRFYRGKAHEVRKLIRMAGYTDEEGADLIDRTVGRNKDTEFLYQGKYGQRHDKKTARHKKEKYKPES